MRYPILASDYDGTLALHGKVSDEIVESLKRFLASGRKLLLVTGRELPELLDIFPHIELFEMVVAENGGLLYRPSTREETVLAERPPDRFVDELRAREVTPISVGKVVVATWRPHETTVVETIQSLGLELQVIFNKGAVMILPTGVSKAFGMSAALEVLKFSPHEVVAIGDAENDHAFLELSECSFAVANALPSLKERADLTTANDHGRGVVELIDHLLANDLADLEPNLKRRRLTLGADEQGNDADIRTFGESVLIAGPSGSGKTETCTSLLERFSESQYQFCVIDPEGDHEFLDFAIPLGTSNPEPLLDAIIRVLGSPKSNVVASLVGTPAIDRPETFAKILPHLLEMRVHYSRPHWIVIDEAHHVLPTTLSASMVTLPTEFKRSVFVTVQPDQVHRTALEQVDVVVAVGARADQTIENFCRAISIQPPPMDARDLEAGDVLFWRRSAMQAPILVHVTASRIDRRRHSRKYAEGDMRPETSFYFRGPEKKLNLRANNLMTFLDLADGVDDETWTFHLERGDYTRWFRERIKDEDLAEAAKPLERSGGYSPAESRKEIRKLVEARYTLPAVPVVVAR